MPKQIAVMYVFRSDSSPAKTYQALQYVDGSTSCECPGWKYKQRTLPDGSRTCKHTRYIDSGVAEQHAEACTKYAEVVSQPRKPIQVLTGGKTLTQGELKPVRNRVIILD